MKSQVEIILESVEKSRDTAHQEVADLLLEDEEDNHLLKAYNLLRRAQIIFFAARQEYVKTAKVSELVKPLLSGVRLLGYAEALKDVYERNKKPSGDPSCH